MHTRYVCVATTPDTHLLASRRMLENRFFARVCVCVLCVSFWFVQWNKTFATHTCTHCQLSPFFFSLLSFSHFHSVVLLSQYDSIRLATKLKLSISLKSVADVFDAMLSTLPAYQNFFLCHSVLLIFSFCQHQFIHCACILFHAICSISPSLCMCVR